MQESFVMEILSRLVSKQIWKLPKLWTGFLKCAHQTKPKSFHVLLQLPTAQLEDALKGFPSLKEPLAAHADQPSVRPTVPRSSLVLLGLCQDTPAASNSTSAGQESNTEVSKQWEHLWFAHHLKTKPPERTNVWSASNVLEHVMLKNQINMSSLKQNSFGRRNPDLFQSLRKFQKRLGFFGSSGL